MSIIIVAHGGVTAPKTYSDGPQKAVTAAGQALKHGATALDAAVEGAVILEDDPRFDAGIGSWLRLNGTIEMDATVMDSKGKLGMVATIQNVRNPVRVARCVADSPHVFICGAGATRFARARGFPYFNPITPVARKKLRQVKNQIARKKIPYEARKWRKVSPAQCGCDTIGVVLYDGRDTFAVAASTGGTAYSLPGRIGDTPIIGCGFYAGKYGAVAATGVGEEIIKKQLAGIVYSRLQSGQNPQQACNDGLKLFSARLPVGIIAVTRSAYGIAASHQMPQGVLKISG